MDFPQRLNDVLAKVKSDFGAMGVKCPKKLVGTLTVELIRQELSREGLPVSKHDVFISGVEREIDLLIPNPQISPSYGLLYQSSAALVVLEVKGRGVYGQNGLEAIKTLFEQVKQANKGIQCMYVSAVERKGYKWAATADNLGCQDVYTLSRYTGEPDYPGTSTGDWEKFLRRIHDIVRPFSR